MGWTGDAQIFCGTACYNMYTPAFFSKYLHDMLFEQKYFDGAVPHVVPQMMRNQKNIKAGKEAGCVASCAWGDAAAVIPWTIYLHYGDKKALRRQFQNMCGWVDYIKSQDEKMAGHGYGVPASILQTGWPLITLTKPAGLAGQTTHILHQHITCILRN